MRNRRYDLDASRIHKVRAPVVCVGNLTMGGTGKSPVVRYLVRYFAQHEQKVAVVSRGYRSASSKAGPRASQNDEAMELAAHLPNVPHIQNPDRVAAAQDAIQRHGVDILVLDDGFQHRRLARDLDFVLLDALEPFGFDHVFPRGMLREPISGLKRANVVGLSRADLVTHEQRLQIRQRVAQLNPDATWVELRHQPKSLLPLDGTNKLPIKNLHNRRVLGFCGLGNPEGFRNTLESCGAEVADFRIFPDHHSFTSEDIRELSEARAACGAELMICSHKDLVKLDANAESAEQTFALVVEVEVTKGETELQQRLHQLIAN